MKKKAILIGGVVVGIIGMAAAWIASAKNSQICAIKQAMDADQKPTAKELELWDMNSDGKITFSDLLLAKCKARFDKDKDATHVITPDRARQLGRTAYHADTKTLWCSLSGSGIEFHFFGTLCELTIVADSSYAGGVASAARYAYYVNDKEQGRDQLTEQERRIRIEGQGNETAVRIVKLSESAQSSMGIRDITVTTSEADHDDQLIPVFGQGRCKEHCIEFIGDSITCGYGVDGVFGKDVFRTANEDATKAYAILTAEALDADYSLVSYSGHGILSGYTTEGKLNRQQLVPPYYSLVGHSAATLDGKQKIQDDLWDFSVQPDLIVINLGTNDASYTGTDETRQQEFTDAYVTFLKKVREKNPTAPILCTLGIMDLRLCDAVEKAAAAYRTETDDDNIAVMRFDIQQQADGYAVDWHPSALTHRKAAEKLTAYIREWLKW